MGEWVSELVSEWERGRKGEGWKPEREGERKRGRKNRKQESGAPFRAQFPRRTHARAVHIFIHVNGCRPEFHPVCVFLQTWVTPRDLVLFGEDEHCFAVYGPPGWVAAHLDP